MHRFYIPKADDGGDGISLGADESHHLRDVLRLGAGDEVQVFDGEGGEYLCRVETIERKTATLSILEKIEPSAPESPLELTLASAILKGEKFDLVIQKAVELGVSRFVPLLTARCDVKVKDNDRKRERWQKIAVGAAMQCGRATLMTVDAPIGFSRFVEENRNRKQHNILFSERGGRGFADVPMSKKITALIGPEGGWDDRELDAARERGIAIVTLGGRILRAETAAISIAAILQHRFGDIN
jgi:16S rRNA (uracil1498-N3)-methyltransferase